MMHKTEHKLLIVDDDEALLGRLARVMERKGFIVTMASCLNDARECIKAELFTHAILDLKLEQGSGLDIVQILKDHQPDCRVVMLTGFGNIATAVSAVKAGAIDYLPKPADPDAIVAALLQKGESMPPPPKTLCRLIACGGNIFNGFMSNVVGTYRKQPDALSFTVARYKESLPNTLQDPKHCILSTLYRIRR